MGLLMYKDSTVAKNDERKSVLSKIVFLSIFMRDCERLHMNFCDSCFLNCIEFNKKVLAFYSIVKTIFLAQKYPK